MRANNEQTSLTIPEKLFTIPECALALGCNPGSLYKAVNGQLGMPAPRTIRIGRLVRVRDCDFQEFLASLSSVKTTVGAAKKKMGRPTRAMQIAARQAAAASSSLVGGAA